MGCGFRTIALLLVLLDIHPATSAERRCGWLLNPTPSNWWLRDREAKWTLSMQGLYTADGFDDMPEDMRRRGWVETNGSYGYGCACLTVVVDRPGTRIVTLLASEPLPLSRCRADRALPRP